MNLVNAAEVAPSAPDNLYALIYLVIALAVGGGLVGLINAYKQWKAVKQSGRKDRITELEDWANDMIRSRDFYSRQSQWRGELNGRLIYVINSRIGADAVASVMETMPAEPIMKFEEDDRNG